MGYNVPSFTTNDISFGPGIIRVGATGATPATDVGAITEDGVTLEFTVEGRSIRQGNPLQEVYKFATAHAARISLSGIEWNFDRLSEALGSGSTTSAAGLDTMAFGGDPTMSLIALQVEHAMAQSGQTLYVDVWQAVADPAVSVNLGVNEHTFPLAWTPQRVTKNWANANLDAGAQLLRVRRITA